MVVKPVESTSLSKVLVFRYVNLHPYIKDLFLDDISDVLFMDLEAEATNATNTTEGETEDADEDQDDEEVPEW